MEERWFGPAEVARKLGVTVKALKVYEREGLVKPLRTAAGWRAYGPEQLGRLHQVLALKRLGLPLQRIGELLANRFSELDAVLDLQQQALARRRNDLERALALLAEARTKLSRGSLSPDDIIQLTRETTMDASSGDEWREVMEPLVQKHFNAVEIEEIGRRKANFFHQSGYDRESFVSTVRALATELRELRAAGDDRSPRACEFVRRWNALTSNFSPRENTEQAQKAQAIWAEVTSTPEIRARLPIQPEEVAFIKTIADGMRARGELPPA